MSLVEQYIAEIDADVKVDSFNIKEVQMKLPGIKHKWVGRYVRAKQELINLQKQRELLKQKGIAQAQKDSVVALSVIAAERMVENSQVIKDIDQKVHDLKIVIELLEKTEKIMSAMTYDIKNMIDLLKLEQLW